MGRFPPPCASARLALVRHGFAGPAVNRPDFSVGLAVRAHFPSEVPSEDPSSQSGTDTVCYTVGRGERTGTLRLMAKRSERRQWRATGAPAKMVLSLLYQPPFGTRDSLVVSIRGLIPHTGFLATTQEITTFYYHGTRVSGTVQRKDSASARFDASFPRAVEYDTLPVGGHVPESGPSLPDGWHVRLADPVITTDLTIDGAAPRMVSSVTMQQAGAASFRTTSAP